MRNLKAILIVLLCLCGIHVQAQQLEIKGLVTSSEDKQPLIGATVAVKGVPGRGVVTDMDGRYTLKIEPSDKILVISCRTEVARYDNGGKHNFRFRSAGS